MPKAIFYLLKEDCRVDGCIGYLQSGNHEESILESAKPHFLGGWLATFRRGFSGREP